MNQKEFNEAKGWLHQIYLY